MVLKVFDRDALDGKKFKQIPSRDIDFKYILLRLTD